MQKDSASLTALISPTVMALGFELVGCTYVAQGRHSILRIYIDKAQGVTLDDCQLVSRQISAVLDVEDPISGGYSLEVSSPGLDRPLFKREHYERFIGQKVRVLLYQALDGQRKFQGIIQTVVNDAVVIQCDGMDVTLPIANIEKANLVPEFGKN